jgi:cell division protein FtsB
MESMELVLTILGGFISILLMVNAYFTRETLLRVVKIEIAVNENQTKQTYIEKQVNENTAEIKRLRDFRHKHENDSDQIVELLKALKQ